ncbi:MAG: zinc-ribbon domain-containing protein, partial [Desulfobacterales bacterium]
MIVTCNECDSSFNVDDSLIKDAGSKVRCSKCSSVFVVYPETSGSERGEDAEDLAFEVDDGLETGLDSDEELADLAMDSGADDELPDLEDMMDFEDDALAAEASAGEDSGELNLDMGEADTAALSEDDDQDREERDMDFDLDEDVMAESDEFELEDIDTDDSDLPDLEMDLEGSDED